MFTGIVATVGKVVSLTPEAGGTHIRIDTGNLDLGLVQAGDSICVSGVCLTIAEIDVAAFQADLSPETLATTTLGELRVGSRVNLEKALSLASPLGGHMVTGHVDGVGKIVENESQQRCVRMEIEVPKELVKYICRKGSVCIDGVSLTVNADLGQRISLQLIPYTLETTTLRERAIGQMVNIEVDILARYTESLLNGQNDRLDNDVTLESLARAGFGDAADGS